MAYDETLELLIGGEFRAGSEGVTEPVIDPATDEVLAEVPHASTADLDAALEASRRGFEVWRATPALERQKVMERAARLLEERSERIARNLTLEMGKPVGESRLELGFAIDVLRWYGEEGKRAYGRTVPARVPGMRQEVIKEPVGPALAFVAWNFPAVNVMRKVAGALGAGCSLIIKPSEETPATAVAIARALQEAGLPEGVLNVVFGVPAEVSSHLIASPIPKKVSFTGSVEVGKHLQRLAADTLKRCTMELGGHAPVMVFADTDVEKVAKMTAAGKFRNGGQVCVSPTRFLVEDAAYDRFTQAFAEVARGVQVGHGLEDGTVMGPLIGRRRLDVMEGFVEDATASGATLLAGGERIGNQGAFFAPTVLGDVPRSARVMNEEPFGPIAPVARIASLDDMLDEANRLSFGLAAYAFTSDRKTARALRDGVESGMLALNSLLVSTPETPFGGIHDSGYGSEGGIEGLEAFQRTRFVTDTDL
ncbi:NAD-dependent succinate-semialdehyde dehydrogenase [Rhodosalinus sp.]|uniref:NAD-dependent succinate-semialdehyde dehydrogenase n=1 Tax=Rhodosalinus sp. TaxID=2047741 RepID=UPI00356B0B92